MKRLKYIILFTILLISPIAISQKIGTFIDKRDSTEYKFVKIGKQIWMAENLKYNSDSSFVYENKKVYGEVYGRLYKYEFTKNICPTGWHLPSFFEWQLLIYGINNIGYSGGEIKKRTHWSYPNKGATDVYNFSALPTGYIDNKGNYMKIMFETYFMTKTSVNKDSIHTINLSQRSQSAKETITHKKNAISIRCVKN